MANNFRDHSPKRTYKGSYNNYRDYKPYLKSDFSARCGYTNCSDFWFGGQNNFHIDHFIPWKKYPTKPELKTNYSNLVYACSYVNILKSDDEGQYIDPCDTDFNSHFSRDVDGKIVPIATSSQGNYMYKKLKLYMRRYQVIWLLDNLKDKMNAVKSAIELTTDDTLRNSLLMSQGELANLMLDYMNYLGNN